MCWGFLVACSKNVLVAESSNSGPGELRVRIDAIIIATKTDEPVADIAFATQLGTTRDAIAKNRGV
jgi:hypothetical protein